MKDKLELIYLPPYSPDQNVIERFWHFTRKKCTHDTYYATFMGFIEALSTHFNAFATPNDAIQTLCAF